MQDFLVVTLKINREIASGGATNADHLWRLKAGWKTVRERKLLE
jgi:hypothetical protein